MKKKRLFGALSILLAIIMVLSVISLPSINAKADTKTTEINKFITNWYKVALGRTPTKKELSSWRTELTTGVTCGSKAAYGFIFSSEYQKKKKSNDEYVTDLYKLMLGRTPAAKEKTGWVKKLKAGSSRESVFAGFANSVEYYTICKKLGITAGYWEAGVDPNQLNNVNMFVSRLYDVCLGRLGDKDGQADWVAKLIKGQITGSQCAHDFIFSDEYVKKNLTDGAYVKNLYKAIMGRTYDKDGYNDWTNKLKDGMSRDEVFAGFANSSEFDKICKQYGINRGNYKATDIGNYKPFKENLTRPDQLSPIGDKPVKSNKLKDQYGNNYSFAYYSDGHDEYQYVNNGRFDKFKGVIYIPDGVSSNIYANLRIYGSDKKGNSYLLYQSDVMTKTSKAIKFDVNISGTDRVFITLNTSSYNTFCIGDCYFYKVREPKAVSLKSKPINLNGLTNIGSYADVNLCGVVDNYGNYYPYAISADYNERIEYLLDKKYKKLTFKLFVKNGRPGGKLNIYADDKIIKKYEIENTDKPISVSLDMNGVNDLKIEYDCYPNSVTIGTPYLYLK